MYFFWTPEHYIVAGNVTLLTFIRKWWLKVRICSHNYVRWDRRKMLNLLDTCLHYLEARVYNSIKKTDSWTEVIHMNSLPQRSSRLIRTLPPGLKSSWIKLSVPSTVIENLHVEVIILWIWILCEPVTDWLYNLFYWLIRK